MQTVRVPWLTAPTLLYDLVEETSHHPTDEAIARAKRGVVLWQELPCVYLRGSRMRTEPAAPISSRVSCAEISRLDAPDMKPLRFCGDTADMGRGAAMMILYI